MDPSNAYVAPSTLPGAGRGLFASSDLGAGSVIFAVKRPLLAIVDEKNLSSTCDECFTYFGEMGRNVGRLGSIEFLKCEGCEVVWYCSQTCKDNAWTSNHQYECSTYKAVKEQESDADFKCTKIGSKRLRCIIRLLFLHRHGRISPSDFATFTNLAEGFKKLKDNNTSYMMNAILKFGITKLPLKELEHLILAAANNECQLDTPNLLTSHQLARYGTYLQVGTIEASVESLPLGMCLEPHYSMINHSCTPNAFWTFEGREIQVRAERDLKAGEEVFISYIPRGYFYERMERLGNWGIKCVCDLCKKGLIEPLGSLRGRLDKVLNDKNWNDKAASTRVEILRQLVEYLRREGYGWGVWPMNLLYSRLYHAAREMGDKAEMLKVLVKMRYAVEMEQEPKAFLTERVETIRLLTSIMARVQDDAENQGKMGVLVGGVYIGMRQELLKEIEGCYGSDSSLARWERYRYMAEIGDGQKVDTEEFRGRLKCLLRWAGVDWE